MPWHGGPGGGFTEPGVRTWLPMTDPSACNVADQDGDADSVLELCRRVIARAGRTRTSPWGRTGRCPRPKAPGPTSGATATAAPSCCSTCRAGRRRSTGCTGTVALSTDAGLEGSACEGALTLGPWLGAVVVA